MKRLLMSIALAGSFFVMTGCCNDGGCAGYVRPVSCCNSCATSSCGVSACNTCAYGYGYNDWY